MRLKFILQILLLLSILIILFTFYYTFLRDKNIENTISNNNNQTSVDENDETFSNELINVEYNSSDKYGNTFYLNAERAFISLEDQADNEVNLQGVVSIINIKNRGIINIFSKKAIYNKINHNTSFYEDVRIEYLDNLIVSQNLDVLFTDNLSTIYSNVSYKNNNLNLTTDIILIDMLTGDIKLKMLNKNNKVNLITNYEFIN